MKRKCILAGLLLALIAGLCPALQAAQSDQPAPAATVQPTAMQPAPVVQPAPAVQPAAAAKININTADTAQIEQLPGIGPAIAKDIVQYRESNGAFKSVDDLKLVRGIGDKKLEIIRDKVTIE